MTDSATRRGGARRCGTIVDAHARDRRGGLDPHPSWRPGALCRRLVVVIATVGVPIGRNAIAILSVLPLAITRLGHGWRALGRS